jgi:glycosyltransferase involved in cell wall biosynthesis
MAHFPFIALNMIVKNESRTITRLLESVIKHIDAVVISDTGSTDNTKEVVAQFMAQYPEKCLHWLADINFKNFGYNRTYSLKGCVDWMENTHHFNSITANGASAYILLMDADMIFKQNSDKTLKEFLALADLKCANKLNMFQGSEHFYYHNVRLISNTIWSKCHYVGVTHEYVATEGATSGVAVISGNILKTDFFIEDIGDGGAKGDKFERDIRLLTAGLVEEPTNERYMFYLANTMRDAGHYEDAIPMYQRRIDAGGWFEEVWMSYYEMGNCYMRLNNPDMAVIMWFKGFQFSDYRVENLYEIVKYYCRSCNHKLAYYLYLMAREVLDSRPQLDDVLFFKKDVYEYLLDFEYTICANYYNPLKRDIMAVYMAIFRNPLLDNSTRGLLLNNLKFEAPKMRDISAPSHFVSLLELVPPVVDDEYVASTPTLAYNERTGDLYVNVRYVNYKIDATNGNYLQQSYIGTQNYFQVFKQKGDNWECTFVDWLRYNTIVDGNCNGGYVGLEDVRILLVNKTATIHDPFSGDTISIDNKTAVIYNCNRGIRDTGIMTVECGFIENGATVNDTRFESIVGDDTPISLEKNWVCFYDNREQKCKFIYKWGPEMVIGEKQGATFLKTHTIVAPPIFRDFRGSSNGVAIGDDEIWFICHLVNYEERRFYYHCFVVLDCKTYAVLRYSKLWTFEGSPVEYCLSFIHNSQKGKLVIG